MMVTLNHIALQYTDRDRARAFFGMVLEIPLERSFSIDADLARAIFGTDPDLGPADGRLEVDVFRSGQLAFEVFYHPAPRHDRFGHVCIELAPGTKPALIARCGRWPALAKARPVPDPARARELLFVDDFDAHVFEIKERAP